MQGYPTIKVFVDGQAEDYQGGRSASDLTSYAESKLTEVAEPPEVRFLCVGLCGFIYLFI